jgi:hypothetical protein
MSARIRADSRFKRSLYFVLLYVRCCRVHPNHCSRSLMWLVAWHEYVLSKLVDATELCDCKQISNRYSWRSNYIHDSAENVAAEASTLLLDNQCRSVGKKWLARSEVTSLHNSANNQHHDAQLSVKLTTSTIWVGISNNRVRMWKIWAQVLPPPQRLCEAVLWQQYKCCGLVLIVLLVSGMPCVCPHICRVHIYSACMVGGISFLLDI